MLKEDAKKGMQVLLLDDFRTGVIMTDPKKLKGFSGYFVIVDINKERCRCEVTNLIKIGI